MICPVEIARDLSALRAVRIGDHAEHEFLFEVRARARAHESTGHDVARDGEEDHMVADGEILGISDRHMRRWRERYVEEGYNASFRQLSSAKGLQLMERLIS
jgi:hypothetical protein